MATSTIKVKITSKHYGIHLARSLYWTLMKLGASEEIAHRWAMRCVFIRVSAGGKHKSWIWGGR